MNNTSKIIIGILVVILLAFVSRYTIFKNQIDAWGEGLERISVWETQYKRDHPNATKAEIDAAFTKGIGNIEAWKENYRKEHPNATEAEMNTAFEAVWKNQ